MERFLDKAAILDRIKEHYSLKNNADLARFLGVAPNTITNWYGRGTFDIDAIYTKCVDMDFNWLFSGKEISTQQSDDSIIDNYAKHDYIFNRMFDRLDHKDSEIKKQAEEIGRLKGKIEELSKNKNPEYSDDVADSAEVADAG